MLILPMSLSKKSNILKEILNSDKKRFEILEILLEKSKETEGSLDNYMERIDNGEKLKEMKKGCLEWQGYLNTEGYGSYSSFLVHRLIYIISHGISVEEIEKKQVRHICSNKKCLNILHLCLGISENNYEDKYFEDSLQYGDKCYNAIFTNEMVIKMRKLKKDNPEMSCKDIKQKLGITYVTTSQIRSIVNNRKYKNIENKKDEILNKKDEKQLKKSRDQKNSNKHVYWTDEMFEELRKEMLTESKEENDCLVWAKELKTKSSKIPRKCKNGLEISFQRFYVCSIYKTFIPENLHIERNCKNIMCMKMEHLNFDKNEILKLNNRTFLPTDNPLEYKKKRKLTKKDSVDIRVERKKGTSYKELGKKYNTTPANIGLVVTNESFLDPSYEPETKARGCKLSFEDATKIRERVKNGESRKKLANEYGVSTDTINNIINNKTYKDPSYIPPESKKTSEEERQYFKELKKEGMSCKEIAEKYEKSKSTIEKICEGIKAKEVNFNLEDAKKMRDFYDNGWSCKELAEKYCKSITFVEQVINNSTFYDSLYTKKTHKNRLSEETIDEIKEKVLGGVSKEEIVKSYCISNYYFDNIIRN